MAFSRLVFTVLLISVSCYASNVPVFLWSDQTTMKEGYSPLQPLEHKFGNILKNNIADAPLTVVFSEEKLSVEDFSLKDDNGDTFFPFLHSNLQNSKYLPSVQDPLKTLENLAGSNRDEVTLTQSGLTSEISDTSNFIIINLNDAEEGESRGDLLRRHNDFIKTTFLSLKKRHDNVIGIYTARYPSWAPETHSRVRRQAVSNKFRDFDTDGLRLYVKSILVQEGTNYTHLNGEPTTSSTFNDTVMNTTLTFGDNSIILNFIESNGYWFFNSVTIHPSTEPKVLSPTNAVYALKNYSYSCAENITFTTLYGTNLTRSFVYFEGLKVQPFFMSINESVQFGEAFDCAGFFSAAIWSGLFVVFILLAIMFYGIMMMMDIRTMDRFDDPKGKTITINAAE